MGRENDIEAAIAQLESAVLGCKTTPPFNLRDFVRGFTEPLDARIAELVALLRESREYFSEKAESFDKCDSDFGPIAARFRKNAAEYRERCARIDAALGGCDG